jgi:hypothetical protein
MPSGDVAPFCNTRRPWSRKPRMNPSTFLAAVALVLCAANLGIHFFNHLALFPLLRHRLDDRAGVIFWQSLDHYMGRRMPPFMLTTVALIFATGLLAALQRQTCLAVGASACAVLLVLEIAFTIRRHLNRIVQSWNASAPPSEWRAAIALVAFVCLVASVVL